MYFEATVVFIEEIQTKNGVKEKKVRNTNLQPIFLVLSARHLTSIIIIVFGVSIGTSSRPVWSKININKQNSLILSHMQHDNN